MFQSVPEFLKTVAVLLLIAGLLVIGGIAGSILADAVGGPKAADFANVTFTNATGETISGYLNIQQANEVYPGIILLPDQWGLNEERVRMANRLSERGYAVLALDIYRGQATGVIFRALLLAATTAETDILTDVEAAHDYLASLEQVDSEHIGVIGFGTGGKLALEYAVQHPEVAASVTLYGDVITNPDELRDAGAVMGIFPAEGGNFPVEAFEAALEDAGIAYEVKVYEDVGPGFVSFPTVSVANTPASNAFEDMVAFFDAMLKPE